MQEEQNKVRYQLAKRELNEMAVFDEWLDKKEALLTAKEQYEMVDVPFRKAMHELFERYGITRLENDYIDILLKSGYMKKTWDSEKLKVLIYSLGESPDDYMTEKWVDSSLQMKYKDER